MRGNLVAFFKKPVFSDKRFLLFVWVAVALIGGLKGSRIHNNYLLFKGVFYHTLEQVNLYLPYPDLYHDVNHYGPFFSLVIAPFALLPDRLGMVLWDISMGICLFYALCKLPIQWKKLYVIFYLLLISLYTCVMNSQTNALIASLIIGCLLCLRKEKEIWAAFFIMFGTFIKLYGIVGLAFFFFSKHKGKFILYLFMWAAVFFALPMIISSPSFILQSYYDWYTVLTEKSAENLSNLSQDMSAIGIVRRVSGNLEMPALYVIIPGMLLFALQYIRINSYKYLTYQLSILASTLLFVVLFSTGSESETYIIALTAVVLWYFLQEKKNLKAALYLMLFTIIWTWATTSYIFPPGIRVGVFKQYSLKAFPSLIVWLILVYQTVMSRGIGEKMDGYDEFGNKSINHFV